MALEASSGSSRSGFLSVRPARAFPRSGLPTGGRGAAAAFAAFVARRESRKTWPVRAQTPGNVMFRKRVPFPSSAKGWEPIDVGFAERASGARDNRYVQPRRAYREGVKTKLTADIWFRPENQQRRQTPIRPPRVAAEQFRPAASPSPESRAQGPSSAAPRSATRIIDSRPEWPPTCRLGRIFLSATVTIF